MLPRRLMLGLIASLTLSACALGGGRDDEARFSASAAQGLAGLPGRGLPPQRLEADECGLFLWSVSGTPQFIFFSKAASGSATFLLDGAPTALSQTGAGGDIFGQFTTEQTYDAPGGTRVDIAFDPGEELIDGQRIDSGRILVTDPEGWETILPILGVRACLVARES